MSDRSNYRAFCAPQDAKLLAMETMDDDDPDLEPQEDGSVEVWGFDCGETAGGGFTEAEDFAKAHPDIPFVWEGNSHYAYNGFIFASCNGETDEIPVDVESRPFGFIDTDTGELMYPEDYKAWAKLYNATMQAIIERAKLGAGKEVQS